jgi:hypothetical protein
MAFTEGGMVLDPSVNDMLRCGKALAEVESLLEESLRSLCRSLLQYHLQVEPAVRRYFIAELDRLMKAEMTSAPCRFCPAAVMEEAGLLPAATGDDLGVGS